MTHTLIKQFIFDKPECLTVEYIENLISKLGYKPLRWAIVKSDDEKITLDTVVIEE